MDSNNNNRTNRYLIFDNDMVELLQSPVSYKFSRFDAFIWLMDFIKQSHPDSDPIGAYPEYTEGAITDTKLAEVWHWSRPTVRKFMRDLLKRNIIAKRRHGNAYQLSLTAEASQRLFI